MKFRIGEIRHIGGLSTALKDPCGRLQHTRDTWPRVQTMGSSDPSAAGFRKPSCHWAGESQHAWIHPGPATGRSPRVGWAGRMLQTGFPQLARPVVTDWLAMTGDLEFQRSGMERLRVAVSIRWPGVTAVSWSSRSCPLPGEQVFQRVARQIGRAEAPVACPAPLRQCHGKTVFS